MIKKPLADRIRPQNFAQMAGDKKLFGEKGVFPAMIRTGEIPNMIFFGPSGTGKTTAANILAASSSKTLFRLNATSATLSDVRDAVNETRSLMGSDGVLLYLDEIQYFNKKQQQSLLEFIEDGRITLIASTTENPYFYVYPAIISRSAVFEFKPLSATELADVVRRGIEIYKNEYGRDISVDEDAVLLMASCASGDARRALNLFENIANLAQDRITAEDVKTFTPEIMGMGGFDKNGDGHFDLLSAFQKSIRGSDIDASVFYLAKLLSGGDLISVCRRIQVIASEDIGQAYPQAAAIVRACVESARELGLPEAAIPLVNATVTLASSPKSNTAYLAYFAASNDVASGKGTAFPRCLQNVHFDGENSDGKGQNYKYPHDYENDYVVQQYLPDDIKNAVYYNFGDNKNEQAAKQYWKAVKDACKGKKKNR